MNERIKEFTDKDSIYEALKRGDMTIEEFHKYWQYERAAGWQEGYNAGWSAGYDQAGDE